jgi:molybdenum cofactor synthesis domain-containing protein
MPYDLRTRLCSVGEAQGIVAANIAQMPAQRVALAHALGRVLAQDVRAPIALPPFDRAAVDGFAVAARSTFGARPDSPKRLRITKRLKINSGEAFEIATGAPMPAGADAVVMVEDAVAEGGSVFVQRALPALKNVSLAGEDVVRGSIVLKRGKRLAAQDVAMLAALGMRGISASKKPRIAIASSGNEIARPGKVLKRDQVYDANYYSLSSLCAGLGADVLDLGIVADDERSIASAINSARACDALVFSGASSVGRKDLLGRALQKRGKLLFHGVAMRPGEPAGFALAPMPVFTLPGFPVAAFVAFLALVRPAICRMLGCGVQRRMVAGTLTQKVSSAIGRRDFVRVRIRHANGKTLVEPVHASGAGLLHTLVEAHALLEVPENVEGYARGENVWVELL